MESYHEALLSLAERAQRLRVLRELRQREVATRAGVSTGTVQRFERTGRASIENVLRIALVLGAEDGFGKLFELPKYRTLDEALATPARPVRRRVRKKRGNR